MKKRRPTIEAADGPSTRYKPVTASNSQRVLREGILARVFSPSAPAIVVLQAPAGHGKSTVLRQIRDECEAHQIRCAWLNLDEGDNDGRRHSTHLQRLLRELYRDAAHAKEAPDATSVQQQSHADWFVEVLDRDESPVALIVDEFEVLTDRTVLGFWRDLLLKLPQHVQVFIAARVSPDIGIPRLTVSDRILVLTSRDLCFSEEEVRSFFHAHESEPTAASDIQAIHRCTEGWPAAIQLFRLGMSRMSPAEVLKGVDQFRPRELADYLTECVLDGLSNDVRNFLERTSILNRMNAQICNALTGRSDSQNLLVRLEKLGLFVNAVDEAHLWFRYHSLFASQLREQLLTDDPIRFRLLNRQAAGWFYEQQIFDDAMHHAVAANDLLFAADILEAWSERLVSNGELSIAERWYDCLPIDEVKRRPLLQRRLAWALAFLRQQGKLAELLHTGDDRLQDDVAGEELPMRAIVAICADDMARAFETISRVQVETGPRDRFTGFELSAAANLDGFRNIVIGDFEQAGLRLAAAQALNQQGRAFFSEGYTASVRGLLQFLKGRTAEAMEHLQAALAAQRRALDVPFATAPLACCYLWTLYESNRLDDVLKTFVAYREMVLTCAIPDLFAVGMLSTLRAYRLQDRDDDLTALLFEAEVIAQQNGWPRIVAAIRRERSAKAPVPKRVAATGASAGKPMDVPASWLSFEELFSARRLEPVRLAIKQERYSEALKELTRLSSLRPDCALFNTRLGVCKALLLQGRGLKNPAARQFASTLRTAFESQYSRAILDEGSAIAALLDEYLDSTRSQALSPLRNFAVDLKAALSPSPTSTETANASAQIDISQFSEREKEIVECLSQRMSNREIADSAHISANTVKFHLKKIFAKLGVRRRIEAYSALIGLKRPTA